MKKAIAMLLAMLMILAVAPVSAFAEEADVIVENEEIDADASTETLNGFSLIGGFFETIANVLRLVVQFLENMFSGTGNDALEQMK